MFWTDEDADTIKNLPASLLILKVDKCEPDIEFHEFQRFYQIERLTSVVIQFGGMCGTVRERYDATVPADPAVAVIVAELRRVADGVRSIREHLEDERDAAAERTSPPPALDAAGAVPGAHWVLVGSLQVDLQRVGGGLARLGARS